MNLIGDHTDYNQGFALPMAIDRHTVAVGDLAEGLGSRRKQSTFCLIDVDETLDIDLILPFAPMPGKAANYLLGVAHQFIERDIPVPNVDVVVTSSVPIGAGLASSAALQVAFATFLEQVTGIELDKTEKARLCQVAEHRFPGTPCGLMDMYTAIFARTGHALLLDCRSVQHEPIPLPDPQQAAVLIIDTGVKHDLAQSEYRTRRALCDRVAQKLNIVSLRDANLRMLNAHDEILTAAEMAKATHVITENDRTVRAAGALRAGDLRNVGELMFQSHASLRDSFQVSCPESDALVEASRKHRAESRTFSMHGARMTGAGFGGCVVALCATPGLEQVQANLQSAFTSAFGRHCTMFRVEAAEGAVAG